MEFFEDDGALVFESELNADEFNSWLDPQAMVSQDPGLGLDTGPAPSGVPMDVSDPTAPRLDPALMHLSNSSHTPHALSHTPTPVSNAQIDRSMSVQLPDGFGAGIPKHVRKDNVSHSSHINDAVNATNSTTNGIMSPNHTQAAHKSGPPSVNAHQSTFSPHLYPNQMGNPPSTKMMASRPQGQLGPGSMQPGSMQPIPPSGLGPRQSPQMSMRTSLMSPKPVSAYSPGQGQGPPQGPQPNQQQYNNVNSMMSRSDSIHMQPRNASIVHGGTNYSEVGGDPIDGNMIDSRSDAQSMSPFQGDANFMRRSMIQGNTGGPQNMPSSHMSSNLQGMQSMQGMPQSMRGARNIQSMSPNNVNMQAMSPSNAARNLDQNMNMLGMNSGGMNSGGMNSGGMNSGGMNSGGMNSGGMNSGGVRQTMSPAGAPIMGAQMQGTPQNIQDPMNSPMPPMGAGIHAQGPNFGMGMNPDIGDVKGMQIGGDIHQATPKVTAKATFQRKVPARKPADKTAGSPALQGTDNQKPAAPKPAKRNRRLSKAQPKPQEDQQQQQQQQQQQAASQQQVASQQQQITPDSNTQPAPGGRPGTKPQTGMSQAAYALPDQKIRSTLAALTLYTQALRFGTQTANISEVMKRVDSFSLHDQRVMIAKFEQSRKDTVSSTSELPIMRLVPAVFWRTINEVYSQIQRPLIPEQLMFAGKRIPLMALFQYVQLSGGYIATSLDGNWNQVGHSLGLALDADDFRVLDLMALYVNTLLSFEMYADRNDNIRRSLVTKLEPARTGPQTQMPGQANMASINGQTFPQDQFMRQQPGMNLAGVRGSQVMPGAMDGSAQQQRMNTAAMAPMDIANQGVNSQAAASSSHSGIQNIPGMHGNVPPRMAQNQVLSKMIREGQNPNMGPGSAIGSIPTGTLATGQLHPNEMGSSQLNPSSKPRPELMQDAPPASRSSTRAKTDELGSRNGRGTKMTKSHAMAQAGPGAEVSDAPGQGYPGSNGLPSRASVQKPIANGANIVAGRTPGANLHRNNNYPPMMNNINVNDDINPMAPEQDLRGTTVGPQRGAAGGIPPRYHPGTGAGDIPPTGSAPLGGIRTVPPAHKDTPNFERGDETVNNPHGILPPSTAGFPVRQENHAQSAVGVDHGSAQNMEAVAGGFKRPIPPGMAENGAKRQRLSGGAHDANNTFSSFVEGGQYLLRRQHLSTHGGRNVRYLASLGNEIENWWPDVAFPLDLGTVDLHAVTCSLASRIPAEVRQALDKLAAVSANPRVHESVQHCPRLLANLCNLILSMLHQVLERPSKNGENKGQHPHALKPCSSSRKVHLEIDDVRLLAKCSKGLQPMYDVLKRMRDDPLKKGEGLGEIEIEVDPSTGFETGTRKERPFATQDRNRIQEDTWPYAPCLNEDNRPQIDEDDGLDANDEWGPSIPDFVSDESKPYYFPSYSTRYERIETEICSLGEPRDEKTSFLFTSLCDRLLLATCVLRNLSFSIANRPVIAHKPEFQRLLWQWLEICAENPSLLDTELRTLDLCKDFLTVLGNVGLYLRLPDTRKTLDLMLFLLSFSPTESPYTPDGRIKLMDFDIDVHRYLPNAIDVFVKVALREDPNRKLIEEVLLGTCTQPIYHQLIQRWLKAQNRTELYPAELLTRMFSLAVAMLPLTHFRPPSRDIETRQPYLLQGSLAAEVIVNMIPDKDVLNYDVAASWLNSIECFGARLVRTMNFMGMVVLNQPDGESQRPFAKITQRCVNVVQKLFNKAKRNPEFTSSGIVPSIEHLLGGLMAAKMDKTVVKHLSTLFDENFAVETTES